MALMGRLQRHHWRSFRQRKPWAGRRNKVKALREALRAGPDAVRLFLRNLPDNAASCHGLLALASARAMRPPPAGRGSICIYFDAIEALDFYVPLKEV